MATFRRLVYAALCAGLFSGVIAAAAHQIATVPLILEAETYERAAQHSPGDTAAHPRAAEPGDTAPGGAPQAGPERRMERAAFTLAADLLTAIGFALLLAAGLTLRGGRATWREGLLWGLAGFAVFTVAPGLGLPPELPGSEAAPLAGRQLWWLATVVATGGALALIAFKRHPRYVVLAAALIALPHLYGAPLPAGPAVGTAPEALTHQFVVAATLVSFLFWLALGASTGYFYRRFGPRAG
jgi:cobalt transporter subunit CbtA